MGEDNSEIVNEILNEMNGTTMSSEDVSLMSEIEDTRPPPIPEIPREGVPPQGMIDQSGARQDMNINHMTRQMDPGINMMARNDLEPQFAPPLSAPSSSSDGHRPSNVTLNIQKSSNYVDEITKRLQDPVIFIVVALVMFSPMMQKTLARILPRLFDTGAGLTQWLAVLMKSLFGSLIFVATKNIL